MTSDDKAMTAAIAAVMALLIGLGMGVGVYAHRLDRYQHDVRLCATTADNQQEFKACVEVSG